LQFKSIHFDAHSVFFFMIFIGTSIALALDSLANGFGTTIFFRMTLMEPGVVCSVHKTGAKTGSVNTRAAKTDSKTGAAKTDSKTGAANTRAAKTGSVNTRAAKTDSKTGAAKTDSKTGAAKTGAETVFVFFRFVVGGVAFAGA
jgi:hypothetical protein